MVVMIWCKIIIVSVKETDYRAIPYLKKIQKTYELRETPLEFCWHHWFFVENQQIIEFKFDIWIKMNPWFYWKMLT